MNYLPILNVQNRFLSLVIKGIIAIIILYFVVSFYERLGPLRFLMLLYLAIYSFILIHRPHISLILMIGIIYILPGIVYLLTINMNIDILIWGVNLLNIAIFVTYYVKNKYKFNNVHYLIIIYLIYMIISALIGINSKFISIKTIFTYIQFPFIYIYICSLSKIKQNSIHNLYKLLLVVIFIQVPITVIQRLVLKGTYLSSDLFSGSLGKGSTGLLAVLMSFGYCIIFSRAIVEKTNYKHIIMLILIVIPIIIGSGKFGYLLIVLSSIFIMIINFNNHNKLRIKQIIPYLFTLSVVLIFIYSVLTYVIPHFTVREKDTINLLTNPNKMIEYGFSEQDGYAVGKLARIQISYNYLKNDIKTLLFGFGPGTLSDSKTFGGQSSVSQSLVNQIGSSVGISAIMLDLGLVGLFLFYLLLFKLFGKYYGYFKILKNSKLNSHILGILGIIFCTSLSMVYVRPYFSPIPAFFLWTYSGIVERLIQNETFKNN